MIKIKLGFIMPADRLDKSQRGTYVDDRDRALLAEMGATLQFLSGGRFILGVGAGWHEEEYRAFGYEFPSAQMQVEQLA